QILIQPQRPRHRARHLADFERMGQPVAEMPRMLQEHLGLVLQPAKRRRMDDPVAIALKLRAGRAWPGAIKPPQRQFRFGRVWSRIAHWPDKPLPIVVKSYYFSLTVMTLRNGMESR